MKVSGTYANDALGANELDQLVLDAALGVTLAIGLEVTEVTNVALLVVGGTVGLVVRVDCGGQLCRGCCRRTRSVTGGCRALTVGSGRSAAVGVVAEGVNVHATLSVGVVTGDVP